MFKRSAPILLVLLFALSAAAQTNSPAQSTQAAPADQALLSKVESYMRVLFGWGPDYKVTVGPAKPSPMPGIEEIPVTLTYQGQENHGTVYATPDGRFMIRGEIRDMSKDPFADTRDKITIGDSPSIGPANAKLTVVEFSDFECPHCAQVYSILKIVEPEFPQVRFVYKNFPLAQIHPWAMSAALAGRCVYKNSSAAFVKFQDSVFTNQDSITADNAWDQLTAYAVAAGLNADTFHSCMTAPETKTAVDADLAEGKSLDVESTPTFFINGRPVVGGDRPSLEQVIRFDLARAAAPSAASSSHP